MYALYVYIYVCFPGCPIRAGPMWAQARPGGPQGPGPQGPGPQGPGPQGPGPQPQGGHKGAGESTRARPRRARSARAQGSPQRPMGGPQGPGSHGPGPQGQELSKQDPLISQWPGCSWNMFCICFAQHFCVCVAGGGSMPPISSDTKPSFLHLRQTEDCTYHRLKTAHSKNYRLHTTQTKDCT